MGEKEEKLPTFEQIHKAKEGGIILKKDKEGKILAELCTDPSRQSILSHAPKLTKQHSVFKDLLKEEKEKLKTKKNK